MPHQAEQRLGPSSGHAEGTVLQEAGVHPAALGDGRQHQRVGPQQRAGHQPGQRAVARAALPVHAAQQRRRKLRHRGEADEADADQRIGLAGDAEVQPAQQQQRHDDGAADAQQRAGEVAALGRGAKDFKRSKPGSTRSLQTMVLTAMASTMTMPVAADSPPTKATSASAGTPAASGSDEHEGLGVGTAPAAPGRARCRSTAGRRRRSAARRG